MKAVWIAICAACSAARPIPKATLPVDLVAVRSVPTPCSAVPPRTGGLRHWKNHVTSPLHARRGEDLLATASAATQTIEGWALEDEDVEVYACIGDVWHHTGTARADRTGHFALAVAGDARVPSGTRDLYLETHDGNGARFLAFVAADDTKLVISDVDGTLTNEEHAFVKGLVLDRRTGVQPGAAEAYRAAAARGFQVVYVTARGNQFIPSTRAWLEANGFPRGPLRLSQGWITLPGTKAIGFKTATLAKLPFAIAGAVGNRATDITAYTAAGIAPDRIFIKLPEYAGEVQAGLAAGKAIGFARYDDLRTQHIATW